MSKKDYQNWTKEDLIRRIKELEKRKKYGLVWEEKPEEVVEMCREKLPILEEVKSKEIITGKKRYRKYIFRDYVDIIARGTEKE